MTSNEQAIRHLYHLAEAQSEDLAGFAAGFTPDGVFVDMASGMTLRGRGEVWKPTAIMSAAFPDMHRELHTVHVAGDVVIVELSLQGTHRGPLQTALGRIPPTGRTMDAPCCDIFTLENGQVTLFNCYNQNAVIFGQLGVLPHLQSAMMP